RASAASEEPQRVEAQGAAESLPRDVDSPSQPGSRSERSATIRIRPRPRRTKPRGLSRRARSWIVTAAVLLAVGAVGLWAVTAWRDGKRPDQKRGEGGSDSRLASRPSAPSPGRGPLVQDGNKEPALAKKVPPNSRQRRVLLVL